MACGRRRQRQGNSQRLLSKRRRVLDRNSSVYQSNGTFSVARHRVSHYLYFQDLFHTTVNWSTGYLLLVLVLVYFAAFTAYVPLFMLVKGHCHTDYTTWMGAFFFSVETMMTIGYGTSDPFFDGCWSMALIISTEAVVGSIMDAIVIGLLYDRLSRANSRASTVLFSRYAVIKEIDGRFWFQFRVVEMRKHQMCEQHVRCYVLRHERKSDNGPLEMFQSRYMRITDPDDELGGHLWLLFPAVVGHRMDTARVDDRNSPRSPILPTAEYLKSRAQQQVPPASAGAGAGSGAGVGSTAGATASAGSALQIVRPATAAAVTSNTVPPSAGDSSRSASAKLPMRDVASVEQPSALAGGSDVVGHSGSSSSSRSALKAAMSKPNFEQIRQYWIDRELEVVCLVEGIDSITSDTTQARHSYTIDDVFFNREFAPCVSRGKEGGDRVAHVDFDKFHDII